MVTQKNDTQVGLDTMVTVYTEERYTSRLGYHGHTEERYTIRLGYHGYTEERYTCRLGYHGYTENDTQIGLVTMVTQKNATLTERCTTRKRTEQTL